MKKTFVFYVGMLAVISCCHSQIITSPPSHHQSHIRWNLLRLVDFTSPGLELGYEHFLDRSRSIASEVTLPFRFLSPFDSGRYEHFIFSFDLEARQYYHTDDKSRFFGVQLKHTSESYLKYDEKVFAGDDRLFEYAEAEIKERSLVLGLVFGKRMRLFSSVGFDFYFSPCIKFLKLRHSPVDLEFADTGLVEEFLPESLMEVFRGSRNEGRSTRISFEVGMSVDIGFSQIN